MIRRLIATAAIAGPMFMSGGLPAVAADFSLTSPDLVAGAEMKPDQFWNNFGCSGKNVRPALTWANAPADTKSFAVTFYDKDAPTGSGFWHWVVYDIPGTATGVDGQSIPAGAKEGNTDVGQPGYLGPCPPVGSKHNYVYTVHALKVDKLEAPEGATAALTGFFLYQNTIAKATLNVTAGR